MSDHETPEQTLAQHSWRIRALEGEMKELRDTVAKTVEAVSGLAATTSLILKIIVPAVGVTLLAVIAAFVEKLLG